MRKNRKLELISGGSDVGMESGRWTLHIKKRGIKTVRDRDINKSFFAFHTRKNGRAQAYRPRKSPMLKSRKWIALNKRGWMLLDGTG